jgi:hypothetical protein
MKCFICKQIFKEREALIRKFEGVCHVWCAIETGLIGVPYEE